MDDLNTCLGCGRIYQDNKKNPDEKYFFILEKIDFQNLKIFKIFKNRNFEKKSQKSKFEGKSQKS